MGVLTPDRSSSTGRPWPRFTQPPEARPVREPAPHEPWPRWGWFPREPRTWSFAPGPSLTAPAAEPSPGTLPARPEPALLAPPAEAPPTIEDAVGVADAEPELDLLPVRRSTSMALVPVRAGEVTLGDVARAMKRVAPAAAVAGVVAAAATALFRRR